MVHTARGEANPSPATLEESPKERLEHLRFLWFVVIVSASTVWLLPIHHSLWIDETGTYWLIKNGLRVLSTRTLTFQGQSPAYYLLPWLSVKALGRNEFALRLPSLICMIIACWLLYRLVRRLIDSEAGVIAVGVFVVFDGIPFAAIDARAYALGLAVLIGATLCLVRWLDEGSWTDATVYVILVALLFYVHYLMAIALISHLVYVLYRLRGEPEVRKKLFQYLVLLTVAALLLVPLASNLASVAKRRALLSVPGDTTLRRLTGVLIPVPLVGGLIAGFLLSRKNLRREKNPTLLSKSVPVLGATWFVAPPIVLWLVSRLTTTELTFARYYLSAAPGIAIVMAWVIRQARPLRARRIMIVCVVLLSLLTWTDSILLYHGDEDWRGAIRAAGAISQPGTPLLVDSLFIEGSFPDWLADPVKRDYILAPLSFYPTSLPTYPIPFDRSPASEGYMRAVLDTVLARHQRITVIFRTGSPFYAWLEAAVQDRGYAFTIRGNYGVLSLVTFDPPPT